MPFSFSLLNLSSDMEEVENSDETLKATYQCFHNISLHFNVFSFTGLMGKGTIGGYYLHTVKGGG